jgi:tRNA 2-selenouridine synthase
MAIQKVQIEQFLLLAKQHTVFDVRSPAEFVHAHIPKAYNLPLFNDEERKIIGTAYKQQSRQQAIKIGLEYFGVKMRRMVEEVDGIVASNKYPATDNGQQITGNTILIHCWRGGMRSAALAWLLDLYGYKVHTLTGGYKAFRNWTLKQFDKEYNFKILGGYTGSGKTILIQELERLGYPVINLEDLANHKGSAFGALGEDPQPSQEMFENMLAMKLMEKASVNEGVRPSAGAGTDGNDTVGRGLKEIWLEDESQRIGGLTIPKNIWEKMRESPLYFIDIDFEERVNYLVNTYGAFEKEKLANAIIRIQKRLGGLETKKAIKYLSENNIFECFRILLNYYDKWYTKGLHNRENLDCLLNRIVCSNVKTGNVDKLELLQNRLS